MESLALFWKLAVSKALGIDLILQAICFLPFLSVTNLRHTVVPFTKHCYNRALKNYALATKNSFHFYLARFLDLL